MEPFSVYKDIQARTSGQFLLGVVGPVRTGKSTFIRRFMEIPAGNGRVCAAGGTGSASCVRLGKNGDNSRT